MSNVKKRRKKKKVGIVQLLIDGIYFIFKIVIVLVLAMLIVRGCKSAYDYGYRIFGEEPMAEAPGELIQVVIEESDSSETIAEKLKAAGLIRDEKLFVLQEKLMAGDDIKPGTYNLNNSWTTEEIVNALDGSGRE